MPRTVAFATGLSKGTEPKNSARITVQASSLPACDPDVFLVWRHMAALATLAAKIHRLHLFGLGYKMVHGNACAALPHAPNNSHAWIQEITCGILQLAGDLMLFGAGVV